MLWLQVSYWLTFIYIYVAGLSRDGIFLYFSDTEGIPQWEKELQQELQDYEMVDDNVDDADIENEILQQLEEEETDAKWWKHQFMWLLGDQFICNR